VRAGLRPFSGGIFAAAGHLRAVDFLDGEIAALEAQVAGHVAAIPAAWGVDADGTTGPAAGSGADAAVLPAVARLDEIPGISPQAAIALITEFGLDMSRFPTPEALVSWAGVSWAGLAPVADQSPTAQPAPPRSSPNGTAACPPGRAGAAGERPASLSAGPPSLSSGTCSRPPKPATPTSDPTTTRGTPTPVARSAATSANWKHSAVKRHPSLCLFPVRLPDVQSSHGPPDDHPLDLRRSFEDREDPGGPLGAVMRGR
jgi:hypothetical protein